MKNQISYAVFTDIGDRPVNEDSLIVSQQDGNYCFVLCDGLGGHGMGDVASSVVTQVFDSQFRNTKDISAFLDQTFSVAQDVLLGEQIARNAQKKMKTTVTAVVTDQKNAYIGHIGDSRVYIFRHGRVKCRTLDHSIPQMLVFSGELKEKEIRNHPDRNMLLRVMGVPWEEPMQELMKPVPLKKCQAFLLCSDGFWELIEEKKMCELLKNAQSPQQWLQDMVEVVKENGKRREKDNFSAIAVWCRE